MPGSGIYYFGVLVNYLKYTLWIGILMYRPKIVFRQQIASRFGSPQNSVRIREITAHNIIYCYSLATKKLTTTSLVDGHTFPFMKHALLHILWCFDLATMYNATMICYYSFKLHRYYNFMYYDMPIELHWNLSCDDNEHI